MRTSSKSDAFYIPKTISLYTSDKDTTNDFRLHQEGDFQTKETPAALTLGQIPPSVQETGGITARSYRQNVGFMLAQLRGYQFPVHGKATPERNVAARKVLIALGLLAIAANAFQGVRHSFGLRLPDPGFPWSRWPVARLGLRVPGELQPKQRGRLRPI